MCYLTWCSVTAMECACLCMRTRDDVDALVQVSLHQQVDHVAEGRRVQQQRGDVVEVDALRSFLQLSNTRAD